MSDVPLRWVPADHPVAVALAADQQRDLPTQSSEDKLDARRTGVARMVITAFEDRARERGLTRLRPETARAFTAAVALYRSSGYVEIPAFGEYVDNPIS
jgi:GNAT superfamily N-acetyltransferase